MAIIRQTNKKTGITYVIESESYWDKEKQQPRSRRKIIGKIDEVTGEVVPTQKRGKRAKVQKPETMDDSQNTDSTPTGSQKENADSCVGCDKVCELEEQVRRLTEEKEAIFRELRRVLENHDA